MTPQNFFRMATNFTRKGELEVAKLGYQKALEFGHPEPWKCYYRLAYIATLEGDESATKLYFERAFETEPSTNILDVGDGQTLIVP